MPRAHRVLLGLLLALLVSGCDGLGVEGGSSALQARFSGIGAVQVLSPTSVQVNWTLDSGYTGYNVYISTQDAPIASNIVFGTYQVTGLSANTSYSFSVAGVKPDGSQDGISNQIMAQTWAPFVGPASATATDASDVNLSWNYQNGPTYQIFYKQVPIGQTPATLTSSDLQGQPNMTSQSATGTVVGGLLPNSTYTFAVTAKYLDGTNSLSNSTGTQTTSLSGVVTSTGQLLTVPTVTTAQQISTATRPSFTVSGGASTYVTTVFQGSLANSATCPNVPAGQVVSTVSGNNTSTSTSMLTAGSYIFSAQIKDSSTGYCAYESIGPVTVTAAAGGGSVLTVTATTPSGLSPLPVVTANPVQLGSFPTFTVTGAMPGYQTQITYNGSPIASLIGNGTMTTLTSNPLPLGQVQVTPVVSYGGESATLSPITILIKGIDSTPVIGPSQINGASASTPALGTTMVVGDFNCDGYPDLAVSAPVGSFAPSTNQYISDPSTGAVAVYYGTSAGLDFSTAPSASPSGTHAQLIVSPVPNAAQGVYFGQNMAVGNLNGASVSGKPCSDLVVTVDDANGSNNGYGLVVYYGSASGLQITPTYTTNTLSCNSSGSCQTGLVTLAIPGLPGYGVYGAEPQGLAVGDFNGDGYDDIAWGNPVYNDSNNTNGQWAGEVFIYFGSQYGVTTTYKNFFPPTNLTTAARAEMGNSLAFGNVQSHASDSGCTAHGCKDLIVGVPMSQGGDGGVIVLKGNSAGSVPVNANNELSTATGGYGLILPGNCASNIGCGMSVTTMDLNQDGYDDIIFNGPLYNSSSGSFFVYYGNSPPVAGAGTTVTTNTPIANAASQPCSVARNGTSCASGQVFYRTTDSIAGLLFGRTLQNLGDTNGDGYPELGIGAIGYGGSTNGAAYIYYGGEYGIASDTSTLAHLSSAAGSAFGMGLAGANFSANDFSSQFPSSSGTLSPQYHDLAIGSPGETFGPGNPGQGVVHYFANTGSGLGSSLTADTSKAPGVSTSAIATGLRSDLAVFAGDINGDGYADVVMPILFQGPPTINYSASGGYTKVHSNLRWGFVVYYGSPTGLLAYHGPNSEAPEPAYAPLNPTDPLLVTDIPWGLTDSAMGENLSAGDFNGDGFSDVIAATTHTYLFYGSSTGLLTQITPQQNPISVLDPKIVASFGAGGYYVSNQTVGDFNGDGYADLAIQTSSAVNNNGTWIYVIYGSQSGIVSGGAIIPPTSTPSSNAENNAQWSNTGNQQVLAGTWPSATLAPLAMYTCSAANAAVVGKTCNVASPQTFIPFAFATSQPATNAGWNMTGAARIAAVGDVDHDGTDDLAMIDEVDSSAAGALFIFYGNQTNGIQPDQYARIRIQPLWGTYNASANPPTYTPESGGEPRALGALVTSNPPGVGGGSLSKAYDVNGDGVNDIVIGSMTESSGTTSHVVAGGTSYIVYGINGGWKSLGTSVCVPDPQNTQGSGYPCTVSVTNWASSADNYMPTKVITNSNSSCNPSTNSCNVLRFFPTGYNTATWSNFGYGVLGLKDITGDGIGDVAVTQFNGGGGAYGNFGNGPSRLFIFSGSVNGLQVGTQATSEPNCSSGYCTPYTITLPTSGIAYTVNGWQGSGDVDHDGYADFMISSEFLSDPTGQGSFNGGFYLFH